MAQFGVTSHSVSYREGVGATIARTNPASKCPPEESGLYFALTQYEIINKVLRALALKYHEHQKEESKLFHAFMYTGFYHAVADCLHLYD